MTTCESTSSADTTVREEGRGGGAPGAGADSLAACGENHGEAAVSLQPLKGSWWRRDHRDPPAAPEGPHAGAGEEYEEEGAAETTYDEPTVASISCSTDSEEKTGSEVELEEKGGAGGRCFKIWVSHCPALI